MMPGMASRGRPKAELVLTGQERETLELLEADLCTVYQCFPE